MTLSVYPIPAFNDNYIWALHDGRQCAVVDPGDAAPVRDYLQRHKLNLKAILITHHHHDHTGGLQELLRDTDAEVYGPEGGHIPGIKHAVGDQDEIRIMESLSLKVIAVPGHTLDHIAYYAASSIDITQPLLFCGDTLFAAGCGRIFEGTPEMMYQSLQKLATLPEDTLVYCAHEYTLNNLRFAAMAEPGNGDVARRLEAESAKRQLQQPTLPSNIGLELRTNPFLRCHTESLDRQVTAHSQLPASHSPEQLFAELRRWKDKA